MSWRIGSLLSETMRNLNAWRLRTLATLLSFSVVLGAVALIEAQYSAELLDYAETLRLKGGYVAVASDESGLDAARCEALQQTPYVVASGGLKWQSLAETTSAPGALFQTATATRGALAVWDPSLKSRSPTTERAYLVGHVAATELGLRDGSMVKIPPEGLGVVSVVFGADSRNATIGRAILTIQAPEGLVDECWVEFLPVAFDAGQSSLAVYLAGMSGDPVVRPLVRLDEFSRNPGRDFETRPHRLAWLVGGAVIATMIWLSARFRRGELGLYRALGVSRLGLLTMAWLENSVVCVAAWIVGVAWASAVHAASVGVALTPELTIAIASSASALALAVALAPLGVVFASSSGVAQLLKER